MEICIIAVGKCRENTYLSLIDKYSSLINWKIFINEIGTNKAVNKIQQENLILDKINKYKPNIIIALDERGSNLTSEKFANKFENWQNIGQHKICFLIGGADGFTENIRKKANFLLSFGKQTWPHMLVRVMILEQIYRSQQILAGHPYHRS